MNAALMVGVEQDVSDVSFSAPVRALSWAVLNGGLCYADHIINHQVQGKERRCAPNHAPGCSKLYEVRTQRQGVAMATAVEMKNLTQASMSGSGAEVTCFAVGCGNALSAGDPASGITEKAAQPSLHTINMIAMVQPGLTDQAMVEAIQIATEGRVRALYEAGIQSSASNLLATGTGTDCIAIVSLDAAGATYCGKHTNLGELIGLAAYTAVKKGLMQGATTSASTPQGNGNHGIEE